MHGAVPVVAGLAAFILRHDQSFHVRLKSLGGDGTKTLESAVGARFRPGRRSVRPGTAQISQARQPIPWLFHSRSARG